MIAHRNTARSPVAVPQPVPLHVRVGPTAPRLERQTYTVREAAQVLGVGRNMMYAAIRAGRVNVIKLGEGGRKIVIPRDAIAQLLQTGNQWLEGPARRAVG
jgi:excisionase family DNA binding protein